MARTVARRILHHVTQRGNRRQQTFFKDENYHAYLEIMAKWCGKYSVKIWAYCLIPKHLYMIAAVEIKGWIKSGH